jgi:hypothetical protein
MEGGKEGGREGWFREELKTNCRHLGIKLYYVQPKGEGGEERINGRGGRTNGDFNLAKRSVFLCLFLCRNNTRYG